MLFDGHYPGPSGDLLYDVSSPVKASEKKPLVSSQNALRPMTQRSLVFLQSIPSKQTFAQKRLLRPCPPADHSAGSGQKPFAVRFSFNSSKDF
jgi:hypothetical protein